MSLRDDLVMLRFSTEVARCNLDHAENECAKLRRENERLRAMLRTALTVASDYSRVPRGRVWSGRRGGRSDRA